MTTPQLLADWEARDGRLVTLWEIMSPFFPAYAMVVGRGLAAVQILVQTTKDDNVPANAPDWDLVREHVRVLLSSIEEFTSRLQLDMTQAQCDRIRGRVLKRTNPTPIDPDEIINLLTDLRQRFEDELDKVHFGFIPKDKAKYFKSFDFGEKFNKKFPLLMLDVGLAGKCYAHGLNTACVFHLMRVVESGVRAFGKHLKVTLLTVDRRGVVSERAWGQILAQIQDKLDANPRTNVRQLRKHQRDSETASHLLAVKDAWRNPTMHPRAFYDETEALNILLHVKAFMNDLAT